MFFLMIIKNMNPFYPENTTYIVKPKEYILGL
jgi:hypothetical protein